MPSPLPLQLPSAMACKGSFLGSASGDSQPEIGGSPMCFQSAGQAWALGVLTLEQECWAVGRGLGTGCCHRWFLDPSKQPALT